MLPSYQSRYLSISIANTGIHGYCNIQYLCRVFQYRYLGTGTGMLMYYRGTGIPAMRLEYFNSLASSPGTRVPVLQYTCATSTPWHCLCIATHVYKILAILVSSSVQVYVPVVYPCTYTCTGVEWYAMPLARMDGMAPEFLVCVCVPSTKPLQASRPAMARRVASVAS